MEVAILALIVVAATVFLVWFDRRMDIPTPREQAYEDAGEAEQRLREAKALKEWALVIAEADTVADATSKLEHLYAKNTALLNKYMNLSERVKELETENDGLRYERDKALAEAEA